MWTGRQHTILVSSLTYGVDGKFLVIVYQLKIDHRSEGGGMRR